LSSALGSDGRQGSVQRAAPGAPEAHAMKRRREQDDALSGGEARGECRLWLALGSLALLACAAAGMTLFGSRIESVALAAQRGEGAAHGGGDQPGPPEPRLVDHVNVFAGSSPGNSQLSEGNTLPLVARPWGFNHWGPQGYPVPMSREDAWWFQPDPKVKSISEAPPHTHTHTNT
jgi:hypothetical protein